MVEMEVNKLSLDDLKQMAQILLELKLSRKELSKAAFDDKKEFLANAPDDFSWSGFYDYTLVEMLNLFLSVGGLGQWVADAQKTSDPSKAILDSYKYLEPDIQDIGLGEEYSSYAFVALFMALLKSIEAIEVYGVSINTLMSRLKAGDSKALFDIVRIDRSAVASDEVSKCIAIAEFKNDKKFFIRLNNALKRRPKKHTARYGPLRYLLLTLHEIGLLESLSIDDLFQLFCIELKLYPTNGADPARSLKRLSDRWVSTCGTSDGDFMS